jgi:hypothetical protein
MPLINSFIIKIFLILIFLSSSAFSEELKKVGKFKDWEVLVLITENNKVCFVQSKPVLQSPKKNNREARLFVSFRPNDKISDEVSTTSGYEYNNQNSVLDASGKSKYKFDITQR